MVAIGSGGAVTDPRYILDRLPLAHGLQFEQIFWALKKVTVLKPAARASQGMASII